MSANTLKAIAVTAELTGTELSAAALRVMDADLASYPEAQVLRALERCRKELTGRLTLASVIDRLASADGRPGPDEAWAGVLAAQDEAETVVWTPEMAAAFEVARPILDARDKIGARRAFIDAYERKVRDAREAGYPCSWSVSLGHDEQRRTVALEAAVTAGRLQPAEAIRYLPAPTTESPVVAALIVGKPQALLECRELTDAERDASRKGLSAVRAHIAELDRQAVSRAAQLVAAARDEADALSRRKAGMLSRAQELIDAQRRSASDGQ